MPKGLPVHLTDYLELVGSSYAPACAARCIPARRWTVRILREGKRGAIPSSLPPILERLDINPKHWLFLTTQFKSRFKFWLDALSN